MADVHFVFYEKARGTVGRRPAVLSIWQDDLAAADYAGNGLNTTEHGHVLLTVFDANALSSGQTVTVNSLATLPSTSADYEVGGTVLDLDAGLAEALASIDVAIQEAVAASATTQKITLAQWSAYQAHIDALQTARAAMLTADVPLDVALPTLSLPAGTSTKTVAQQIAKLMDPNTVGVLEQNIADRSTLQPEWGFDDPDLNLFDASAMMGSGTIAFSTTTLSGGRSLSLPVTKSGDLYSRPENLLSVRAGEQLYTEMWARAVASGYNGTLGVGMAFYDANKALLPSVGLQFGSVFNLSGTAWASSVDRYTAPAGSKYAGAFLTHVAGSLGTGALIDSVAINRSLKIAQMAALPEARVLGRRAGFGTGEVQDLGGQDIADMIPGGNFQPPHARLTSLIGITGGADTFPYFTGGDSMGTAAITAKGRSILTETDAAGLRTNIGAAARTTTLTAGNGLTGGGDLSDSRTFALGTPSTLTGATTNNTTSTSHTHDINTLSVVQTGVPLQAVGGIGTYALLHHEATNTGISIGDVIGGADLRYAGMRGPLSGTLTLTQSNVAIAGTWRALGSAGAQSGSHSCALFVRIT